MGYLLKHISPHSYTYTAKRLVERRIETAIPTNSTKLCAYIEKTTTATTMMMTTRSDFVVWFFFLFFLLLFLLNIIIKSSLFYFKWQRRYRQRQRHWQMRSYIYLLVCWGTYSFIQCMWIDCSSEPHRFDC